MVLAEAKAWRTALPSMGAHLERLGASIRGYQVSGFVVHRPQGDAARISALRPGVRAGDLDRFLDVVG